MQNLRPLFRLIATAMNKLASDKLAIDPPSPENLAQLETHPNKSEIIELAKYALHNDLEDEVRRLFIHVLRQCVALRQNDRGVEEHDTAFLKALEGQDLPELDQFSKSLLDTANEGVVRNQIEIAFASLQLALDANGLAKKLGERIDEIGLAHGPGAAHAANGEFYEKIRDTLSTAHQAVRRGDDTIALELLTHARSAMAGK